MVKSSFNTAIFSVMVYWGKTSSKLPNFLLKHKIFDKSIVLVNFSNSLLQIFKLGGSCPWPNHHDSTSMGQHLQPVLGSLGPINLDDFTPHSIGWYAMPFVKKMRKIGPDCTFPKQCLRHMTHINMYWILSMAFALTRKEIFTEKHLLNNSIDKK